jgi:hypothetical protein
MLLKIVIVVQKKSIPKTEASSAPSSSKEAKSSTKLSSKSSKKTVVEEKLEIGGKEEAEEDSLSVSISEEPTDEDIDEEVDELSNSISMATYSDVSVGEVPKKKLSWLQKKKKGLASRAAGSSLGSSLFNNYVDKDTQSLIGSICSIIQSEKGSKEAKKTKQEILKVAAKILLLYHEGKVTEDSFNTLAFSFRRICSGVRNAYHAKNLNEATANRIHGVAMIFFQNLQTSLVGLVSENTITRIRTLIDYIFSPWLLTAAAQYDKEFQQIAMVLAMYLETST